MLRWFPIAGWMAFPQLSQSAGINHAFTLGYRLTDNGNERWTERFNRFKRGERAGVFGGARLMYAAIPQLIRAMEIDPCESIFLPALSSGEAVADANRSIPVITRESAQLVGAGFELGALRKNPHGKIHNLYSVDARRLELDKAQYQCARFAARRVFVFDDFITRGDTLSRIALAIQDANPGAIVYGIALAKTERIDFCPNPANDQMSAEWNTIWQAAEAEARAG